MPGEIAPYPLRSPRLRITPLAAADVDDFVRYRQDPEVARWQSWDTDYRVADALALVAGQPVDRLPGAGEWLQLAVRPVDGGPLHGDVAVRRCAGQPDTFELGVTLARAAQGRGIAGEALRAVLDMLFHDAGAHRVVASCDARNLPVSRLLRRVGMRHESRQLEADWFKGEWTTLDGWAVLAREWRDLAPRTVSTSAS
ncbi:GNAT family N-acetyltransferase [Nakamurella endophytica]|uniref:GNAT family N-acetyltransferase n=1 Tax=Nakamurella endophytica TaxID=1748367 RepID=UPI00166EE207|nr:GNAT family N-acetyltransferase [Nakamurella endophytica]